MIQKRFHLLTLLFLIILVFLAGCATSHLNEAKRQYEIALRSENPLPYYKAALEEADAVIARDPNQYQAYAIKGLIYRNLEDYDLATENLEIAKQGIFGGQQEWVPIVINLTYGDIFHAQASNAIREGNWEQAKSYQETALEFFNNVIDTSFGNFGAISEGDTFGVTMQDLYINAQGRWAAGKFQMAVIAGRLESQERQSELLREVTTRLSAIVEAFPNATALRYYLADGYRKQALTIRRTDPEESQRLQERALSQLRACAQLGLSRDLRNPAAQLFSILSQGSEPETEQKLLGTVPPR